jgi:hypothetical protein
VLSRLERDADYRSRLVDDLQELRAFLFQRRAELASPGTELLSALLPEGVQKVDGHGAAALLEAVDAAVGAASAARLRQLLMLRSSARYFERTAGALERKAGQEARMLAAAVEADKRKREAQVRGRVTEGESGMLAAARQRRAHGASGRHNNNTLHCPHCITRRPSSRPLRQR